MSLTKEGNGIIKEVETYNREELLVTELDLTLLDAYNNPYFSDTNPEVYNRYLPKLYEKHCNEVLLR
jgi:hypothetical protein